ncbi:unnamed protein product [Sphagnum troendelagicum]
MEWLKRHASMQSTRQSPFIIGSDKWMGNTTQQQFDTTGAPAPSAAENSYVPPEFLSTLNPTPPAHLNSTPVAPQIFRTYSQNSRNQATAEAAGTSSSYPTVTTQYTADSGLTRGGGDEYGQQPDLFNGGGAVVDNVEDDGAPSVEASQEILVRIPGVMVHLIDDESSPLLGSGDLSVVRIEQEGNGILALVKVGEGLEWPLTKDEPTVKLDPTHYFFTIRVPPLIDTELDTETNGAGRGASGAGDLMNYGVTIPAAADSQQLQVFDTLLERYSFFSSPTLVHGDKQKEDMQQHSGRRPSAARSRSANFGGMVVPPGVVAGNGQQLTEQNQSEFWTTMAPNVNDYSSTMAKGIATGSGHIIRGIFWIRDSTVARLESGSIFMKNRVKSNSKPAQISPQTLKSVKRARKMSRATSNLAQSVLNGVLTTSGFFTGAAFKSKAGKKFFKLLPGEVALVSMDAFGKVFDALEKAGRDIMFSTSVCTQDVVTHRYGPEAAVVTEQAMGTAGHVFATAWTVTKVRRALNPSKFKTSKTGLLKTAAKAAIGSGKGNT